MNNRTLAVLGLGAAAVLAWLWSRARDEAMAAEAVAAQEASQLRVDESQLANDAAQIQTLNAELAQYQALSSAGMVPAGAGRSGGGGGGLSVGGVLGDMGKGASIGATLGSIVPGVGTAIGAGAGAVIGGAADLIGSIF
jgi:hypothetical protein